ncbi:hypothetical protein T484DRAFT_1987192, partial [Baffinella frigidus]
IATCGIRPSTAYNAGAPFAARFSSDGQAFLARSSQRLRAQGFVPRRANRHLLPSPPRFPQRVGSCGVLRNARQQLWLGVPRSVLAQSSFARVSHRVAYIVYFIAGAPSAARASSDGQAFHARSSQRLRAHGFLPRGAHRHLFRVGLPVARVDGLHLSSRPPPGGGGAGSVEGGRREKSLPVLAWKASQRRLAALSEASRWSLGRSSARGWTMGASRLASGTHSSGVGGAGACLALGRSRGGDGVAGRALRASR